MRDKYEFLKSIEYCNRLIEKYPKSPLIDKAKRNVQFLTKHNDNNYEPLQLYFEAGELKRAGNYDEALKKFKKIFRRYPDSSISSLALYWTGKIKVDCQGNTKDGYLDYIKLCEQYPDSPESEKAREVLYTAGIEVKNSQVKEE